MPGKKHHIRYWSCILFPLKTLLSVYLLFNFVTIIVSFVYMFLILLLLYNYNVCRNYMNDSLRTNVFVRFSPETIACACIFLSARQLKV